MATKHLQKLTLKNFKKLNDIVVSDIGQFNLIIGKNDVGKTSLLESLIFDDENPVQFLNNIHSALQMGRGILVPNGTKINYLDFYYHNYLAEKKISFNVIYKDQRQSIIEVEKKEVEDLNESEFKLVQQKLIFQKETKHLIKFLINGIESIEPITFGVSKEKFDRYIPLISFGLNYSDDVIEIFSLLSESSATSDSILKELQFFYPSIKSIEISASPNFFQPLVIVRLKDEDFIRPISTFGDGINKFFRYLLEINFCKDRRLMIDEIDTGIHYSRMKDFYLKLLTTATNKNVQLFATTHSKECIESFTKALEEAGLQNEGRIIRLAETKHGIKAYTMEFAEFENALLAESEIR